MVPAGREWTADDAHAARERHQNRQRRLAQLNGEPAPAARTLANKAPLAVLSSSEPDKKKLIADVLAKARARRQTP